MSPTKLAELAKVVVDLYERSGVSSIEVHARNGTSIKIRGEDYHKSLKKKQSAKIKAYQKVSSSPISNFLKRIDPELERKRLGAWQTLDGSTVDKHAQAANSMREVLSQLLDKLAPSKQIQKASWYKKPEQGSKITRAMKVRWAIARDSSSVSESTLNQVNTLIDSVDATYKKLSAEGHQKKAGKDQIIRACLNACESVIELIAVNS